MDWSRTKTIFILTFLVLDLFLGYRLYQKQSESQIEYISESFLKIEDQLQDMDITYPELPEVTKKFKHIIGETHTFTDEDLSNLDKDGVMYDTTEDGKQLIAFFNDMKMFSSHENNSSSVLDNYSFNSDDYMLSEHLTEKEGELIFIQTYDGKPIYQKEDSAKGQITLQLNRAGQMISFVQTYLDTNEQGSEQEILTAIKAIHQLAMNNKLSTNEEITFIELGYYSLVEGELQVLAPTWLIEVNDERLYYVNAVNGLIDDPNIEAPPETGEDVT